MPLVRPTFRIHYNINFYSYFFGADSGIVLSHAFTFSFYRYSHSAKSFCDTCCVKLESCLQNSALKIKGKLHLLKLTL